MHLCLTCNLVEIVASEVETIYAYLSKQLGLGRHKIGSRASCFHFSRKGMQALVGQEVL